MKTRNHNRARGMTTVTLPMTEALKKNIKELAKLDDRPAATWMRRVLMDAVNRAFAARRKAAA